MTHPSKNPLATAGGANLELRGLPLPRGQATAPSFLLTPGVFQAYISRVRKVFSNGGLIVSAVSL